MNQQAAPDYFELADYTGVLRRRWKSIAVVALVGLVLAGAYVTLAHKKYTATVQVLVSALPDVANAVGGRTGGAVNMDNEGQQVRSAAVAAILRQKLPSLRKLSLTAISQDLRVSVPPNTTVLQISCVADSAATAEQCANAAGKAYLYNRRVSNMNLIGGGINALEAEENQLSSRISAYKTTLYLTRHKKGVPPSSPFLETESLKLAAVKSELASVRAHVNQAAPLYYSLSKPDGTIVGNVTFPATLPTAPSSPRKLLYLPSGLMLGLVVGIGLAFANERTDKRVHSKRDVERFSSLPTVLSLGGKPPRGGQGLESPRTAPGRAYNELAQVTSTALGESGHVIAVAATSPGTSASVVAANLAAALARTTDRAVLICGDVHGTRAPELLRVPRGRGLSEVLTGTANVTEVLSTVAEQPGLEVLTPGLDAARVAAIMRPGPIGRVISDLLGDARYVVIEVQSVGDNSDTFGLANYAEAAIIAVESGRSRPRDISDCTMRIERLGASVLGTAIVPAGPAAPAPKARREPLAPATSPAAARPAEFQEDKPFVGSIRLYEMQPGAPAGSDQRQPFIAGPSNRSVKEPMQMPRAKAGERDGYSNPADPAAGD